MYSVTRLGWTTLMVTDDDERPIDAGLQRKWRSVTGVGFVVPQHEEPHVVAISFGEGFNTREKAAPTMRAMIAELSGSVRYCNVNGQILSESAWYK